MPFTSKKQARYLHAHPEKLGQKKLEEFDAATKAKAGGFARLPERVKKKRGRKK